MIRRKGIESAVKRREKMTCYTDSRISIHHIEVSFIIQILTVIFVVGSGPSPGFFVRLPLTFCALLAALGLVPAIGRQDKQYTVWAAATGINASRSVGTGSATRAGKRR